MFRKGYVEQQINFLERLLAQILDLRLRGDFDQALFELRDGSSHLTGLDIDQVIALPEGLLLTMLGGGSSVRDFLEAGKCITLAALLRERAELFRMEHRPAEALAAERKALTLYCEALIAEPALRRGAYIEQAGRLIVSVRDSPSGLGVAARHRLFHYYEAIGEFAHAEDTLYALRDGESGPPPPGLHGEAVSFYRRLLHLSDDILNAGGLPRDEVETALADLDPPVKSPA